MPTVNNVRRSAAAARLLAGAAAAAGAVSLAACGAASNTSANAAAASVNGAYSQALAYAKCIRAHGVPNFPDPKGNGDAGLRVQATPSSMTVNGVSVSAPAFQSAQQACRSKAPGGGQPRPLSASRRQALLNFSACMRAHGLPGFPDPTFSGNAVGIRIASSSGIVPDSPAFKAAQTACAPIMRRAGLGPPPGS